MKQSSLWYPSMILLLLIGSVWGWEYHEYQEKKSEIIQEHNRNVDLLRSATESMITLLCKDNNPEQLHECFSKLESTLESTMGDCRLRLKCKGGTNSNVDLPLTGCSSDENNCESEATPISKKKAPSADSSPTASDSLLRCKVATLPKESLHTFIEYAGSLAKAQGQAVPELDNVDNLNGLDILLEYPQARMRSQLNGALLHMIAISSGLSILFAFLFAGHLQHRRMALLQNKIAQRDERLNSLEYLRQLGAGLAHETKNPLGSIKGFGELLLSGKLNNKDIDKAAHNIVNESDRLVARVDEFLMLSHPGKVNCEEVELKKTVEDLIELVQYDLPSDQAQINFSGDSLKLFADADQLRRLLLNLMINATQAIQEDGCIDITLNASTQSLEIKDNGCGISDKLAAEMFKPYVTQREGGTGLGLAIAKQISNAHNWRLEYEANPKGGSIFKLFFAESLS